MNSKDSTLIFHMTVFYFQHRAVILAPQRIGQLFKKFNNTKGFLISSKVITLDKQWTHSYTTTICNQPGFSTTIYLLVQLVLLSIQGKIYILIKNFAATCCTSLYALTTLSLTFILDCLKFLKFSILKFSMENFLEQPYPRRRKQQIIRESMSELIMLLLLQVLMSKYNQIIC